jgi:hypothetical protein
MYEEKSGDAAGTVPRLYTGGGQIQLREQKLSPVAKVVSGAMGQAPCLSAATDGTGTKAYGRLRWRQILCPSGSVAGVLKKRSLQGMCVR